MPPVLSPAEPPQVHTARSGSMEPLRLPRSYPRSRSPGLYFNFIIDHLVRASRPPACRVDHTYMRLPQRISWPLASSLHHKANPRKMVHPIRTRSDRPPDLLRRTMRPSVKDSTKCPPNKKRATLRRVVIDPSRSTPMTKTWIH